MNRWISVEDALPELQENVLAFNEIKYFVAHRYLDSRDGVVFRCSTCACCQEDELDFYEPITHWMEIPEIDDELDCHDKIDRRLPLGLRMPNE